MRDIIDLIEADHMHIMRWPARLGEFGRRDGGGREPLPVLAGTWQTLAGLIELHMSADEEICGPAVLGTGERLPAVRLPVVPGAAGEKRLGCFGSLSVPGCGCPVLCCLLTVLFCGGCLLA